MNISKTSRSIVVVIFIAMIVFLSYLDIRLMISSEGASVSSNLYKLAYVAVLVILVLIYMYIKDKLYKMKVKRKVALIYRYIYITIVIIVTNIFVTQNILKDVSYTTLSLYLVLSIVTAFIVKRIIFNVSKSDMLSVFGMFAFSMLPNILYNVTQYFNSMLITFFTLASILAIQVLIDELKQKGIRTKKYIVEAGILGILIGVCTLFGINILVWGIIAFILLFITYNLDNTHISFPKKLMNSITQTRREDLYKIERINISKLLISIVFTLIIAWGINIFGGIVLNSLCNTIPNNELIQSIKLIFEQGKIQNIIFNFNILKDTANTLLATSKTYYIVLFIYILFIEVLSFVLKRRYDTKSTIIKLLFILLIGAIAFLNLETLVYQPLFCIMLVLIAIVNTSNIYLNREERIKMLVA